MMLRMLLGGLNMVGNCGYRRAVEFAESRWAEQVSQIFWSGVCYCQAVNFHLQACIFIAHISEALV